MIIEKLEYLRSLTTVTYGNQTITVPDSLRHEILSQASHGDLNMKVSPEIRSEILEANGDVELDIEKFTSAAAADEILRAVREVVVAEVGEKFHPTVSAVISEITEFPKYSWRREEDMMITVTPDLQAKLTDLSVDIPDLDLDGFAVTLDDEVVDNFVLNNLDFDPENDVYGTVREIHQMILQDCLEGLERMLKGMIR